MVRTKLNDDELRWLEEHRTELEQPGPSEDTRIAKTLKDLLRVCRDELGGTGRMRCCRLRSLMKSHRLSKRDLVVYLNYPLFTQEELALRFGFSDQSELSRLLNRVRNALPTLQKDPDFTGVHGIPALHHMLRIEASADSDDRLNDQSVLRF